MLLAKDSATYRQYIVILFVTVFSSYTYSQCDFLTDFESGSLTGWLDQGGSNVISTQEVHSGTYALKMYYLGGYSQIISNQSNFGFGTYDSWFYVCEPNADAIFRFHYNDNTTFYQLAMMPLSTDNPKLLLKKVINGSSTILANVAASFNSFTWFKMTVERFDSGQINIYINDVLQISVFDTSIMTSNKVVLMGWEDIYVDDFCYSTFPSFTINLGEDIIACEGETVTLYAGSDLHNYVWNNGMAVGNSLNVNSSGSYFVQANDNAGNTFFDTIFVTFFPLPAVSLGNDFSTCSDWPINLSSGTSGYNYLWSTGETTANIDIYSPGIYWISVSNEDCVSFDTVVVHNILEPYLQLPDEIFICEGDKAILDIGNQFEWYSWSTGETTNSIVVDEAGLYSVLVWLEDCPGKDSVEVIEVLFPVIDLGEDKELCGNNSLTINAGNPGCHYLWSTGETTQSIEVNSSNQIIWVEVEQSGCITNDYITINECKNHYGIPTGFSPNNDGENDILFVYGQNINEIEFSVFNRFGQLVFYSHNQNNGWDGTYKGADCEMDVYVWYVKLKFFNGRVITDMGNVSLLK